MGFMVLAPVRPLLTHIPSFRGVCAIDPHRHQARRAARDLGGGGARRAHRLEAAPALTFGIISCKSWAWL